MFQHQGAILGESSRTKESEAAFEGGKWGDRPRPRSFDKKNCCPQTRKKFMNNEKTKFARQVAKVDLV